MNNMARILPILLFFSSLTVWGQDLQRFPPPDFESGYTFPLTQTPIPRSIFMGYVDIAVLFAALCLASYFSLHKRNRQGVFYLTIFSLIYFGFYRQGCICAIGAIQNVTLALFDSTYSLPLAAVAFFLLPLFFTLFFGRVFCAGVCPLGAIQDLVLIKPMKVPRWLHQALSMLSYVYFGAAVLFAAMGSAFIICKYDPFVSFFRMTGGITVVTLGVCLLVIGLFVGRPYCMYLCPYSVLLKAFGQFSQWRVTVGPGGDCVQCDSCEDACPFHAITKPTPDDAPSPSEIDKKRLVLFSVLAPVILLVAAWAGSLTATPFSKMDYTVRLAERIALEDAGAVEGQTDASQSFRDSGQPTAPLYESAQTIRNQYAWGGWIFGAFLGFVIAFKLIWHCVQQTRAGYEADRSDCLACGRCYCSCPLERKRLRQLKSASYV